MPLKRELTGIDCHNWRRNKLKNPISGYTIKLNSPTYKEIEKSCLKIKSPDEIEEEKEEKENKKVLKRNLVKEDCIKWVSNKYKNPITNYTIKENSKIFKELKKECEKILKDENDIKKKEEVKVEIFIKKEDEPIKEEIFIKKEDEPIKEKSTEKIDDLYYPDLDDDLFREKLNNLYEFNIHKILPFNNINTIEDFNKYSTKLCGIFDKTYYQYFLGHYLSRRTPYKGLLIYHSVGVGKTCSAITIAESFLIPHSLNDEPKIWVIMPRALRESFKNQIFKINNYDILQNQCTGDSYAKLAHITKDSNPDKIALRIKKIIKSRYRIFTYDGFVNFIENEYKDKIVSDKVIIIDEAHNIRNSEVADKKIYTTLSNVLETGINNRLVLLSATPMYNEPSDIFDLLYLLLINDKRTSLLKNPYPIIFNEKNEINKDILKILKKLSSNYISYLIGKNPFSFAFKLSPEKSDIPILKDVMKYDMNGRNIPENDKRWIDKIKDGIVISKLGDKQINFLKNNNINSDDINIFNSLQPMNIVYEDSTGQDGFYTFFNRINTKEPIEVKYNKKYESALLPENDYLNNYSGKLLNIANIIKNSNGIVVIYSRYIWSGILPMAVILEHMGFNREGCNNFVDKIEVVKNPPKYKNIKIPKYCILSSENPEIMGNTNIDMLLKIINSPDNIDGSIIKVILMTPVAGEGLSFLHIREMHLLEPWYHFNRIDQIIGRGIRNCSHQNLELKHKNVTVFMHCSINELNKETPDLHAYRISSRKLNQSYELDKIIRDNSIDCYLFKNINYFPKKIFEKINPILIETSQNKKIEYFLGDDENIEPKCDIVIKNLKKNREEAFYDFSLNVKNKIRRIILDEIHNGNNFLHYESINENFTNIDKDIIMHAISNSIYPNVLIDGYTLIPHEDGIHIVKIINDFPLKIKIIKNKIIEYSAKNDDIDIDIILKDMTKYDYVNEINNAIIALYSSLDSYTFDLIVKKIIKSDHLSDVENFIAKCLYSQGVLISKNEMKSISTDTLSKYIGYCNIFSSIFEPIIFINNTFKDCNDRQKAELISSRKKIIIPDMTKEDLCWGIFVPSIFDKEKNIFKNIFKILSQGTGNGKKTGMNCYSLKKSEHSNILKQLHIEDKNNSKIKYCNIISTELLKIDRILLLPEYKPTILQ
jgi:hypothetical protein